jgi:hypothetical protein
MHAPMRCFQNALAYFATVVSSTRKMFMKLTPGVNATKLSFFILGLLTRVFVAGKPFQEPTFAGGPEECSTRVGSGLKSLLGTNTSAYFAPL